MFVNKNNDSEFFIVIAMKNRYQYFLQLKDDILQGKLDCSYDTCVQMCALALQCMWVRVCVCS